jgi:REP element-mobilizing transposase RayT
VKKRQRHSIRLRGYDYTRAGAYFLTMCVQDRICLFGDVDAGAMHSNDAGCMVERWWLELNNKFPGVETDAFVVMPNHVHGIVVLANDGHRVPHGADHTDPQIADHGIIVGADLRVRPLRNDDNHDQYVANERREYDAQQGGGHIGPPLRDRGAAVRVTGPDRGATDRVAVGTVVQWFKTMATNEYIRGVKTLGWPPFDGRVWQRDYWERIVRDADELHRIRRYIVNNPRKWWRDRNNPTGRIVEPFAGQRIVED